jgi:hypothetical protein
MKLTKQLGDTILHHHIVADPPTLDRQTTQDSRPPTFAAHAKGGSDD